MGVPQKKLSILQRQIRLPSLACEMMHSSWTITIAMEKTALVELSSTTCTAMIPNSAT